MYDRLVTRLPSSWALSVVCISHFKSSTYDQMWTAVFKEYWLESDQHVQRSNLRLVSRNFHVLFVATWVLISGSDETA